MLLKVDFVVDNVVPPYKGEKRVVFLAILAVARMLIWVTRIKGLYEGASFSLHFLLVSCTLGIGLGSRLDAIENARTA